MIEIGRIGPGIPVPPDDVEKERFKDIKTRLGKIAFEMVMGTRKNPPVVSHGIAKSEGALKWIEEVFKEEKWKNS